MFGFSTGLSALSAARFAIQTIGHNLSNVGTPGYSRQRVLLGARPADVLQGKFVGGGVSVDGIERVSDALLSNRVRGQQHEVARREVTLQHLRSLEDVFSDPTGDNLGSRITDFFNHLSNLGTAPDDSTLRLTAVQGGVTLAEHFRRVRSEVTATESDLDQLLDGTTSEINRLTDALATLNRDLNTFRNTGAVPPDLIDQQERLLSELSDLVDVSVTETGDGSVDVRIGGQTVVTHDRSVPVSVVRSAGGEPEVLLEGSTHPAEVRSGRLRGLLDLVADGVGERTAQLDQLASALILGFNRIHSTGVPTSGGFTRLTGTNRLTDTNGNGSFLDESLQNAGLPFDVSAGRLYVTVVDDATGATTQRRIDVDPASSVATFVNALNAVPGLSAGVDAAGRLGVSSGAGRRFHFAETLDTAPNAAGTLGSSSGQVLGQLQEPFALAAGDALSVAVDGGAPQTVTFAAGQFANIGQATAAEVAAALNGSLTGATASVADGRVIVTSDSAGTTSQIAIADVTGSPTAVLGLSTTPDFGAASTVDVRTSGSYTGSSDQTFSFRPRGDGTIGVTTGLQVDVLDSAGRVVATLDVGKGYPAGKELEVADGISVSFGAGDISATAGDFFNVTAFRDADDTDALVAFGLNPFFVGSDAATIDVAQELVDDPSKLSQGLGPASADNRNLLRLIGLRDGAIAELDGRSLGEFHNALLAELGTEVSRAELNHDSEQLLLESFSNRLEQVRGVSLDEELADLQRFEQAYQAAARYITAVNEVTQILFSI